METRAFMAAFRAEVIRALKQAGSHTTFVDNFFNLSREGEVTWFNEDDTAFNMLQDAMDSVSFDSIGDACGVFADWGILASFDGPGERDLGGGTMVVFDSEGQPKDVVMRCEDLAVFRHYSMGPYAAYTPF